MSTKRFLGVSAILLGVAFGYATWEKGLTHFDRAFNSLACICMIGYGVITLTQKPNEDE